MHAIPELSAAFQYNHPQNIFDKLLQFITAFATSDQFSNLHLGYPANQRIHSLKWRRDTTKLYNYCKQSYTYDYTTELKQAAKARSTWLKRNRLKVVSPLTDEFIHRSKAQKKAWQKRKLQKQSITLNPAKINYSQAI